MNTLQYIEAKILSPAKLDSYGAPSTSVAILEDGALHTHVFSKSAEDAETVYRADSISKAITALGVARLVDQGRLTYDSRMTNLIPVASFIHNPESIDLAEHVTLRMLLNHTSGLTRKTKCDHASHVKDSFSGTFCLHFSSFPGGQWLYDSDAFALVQPAMENVCGKPFPELMQELIMLPLGMTRSFWGELSPQEANYAESSTTSAQSQHRRPLQDAELATEGMWTTPCDLVKAISAVQQSLLGSIPFLDRVTVRRMLVTDATPLTPTAESEERCGLGWFATPTSFAHRGGAASGGYHSYCFGFFDQELPHLQTTSFAVMTNSIRGIHAMRPLLSAVMHMKRWPRQDTLPSSFGMDSSTPCPAPETVEIDPQWRSWKGEWQFGCLYMYVKNI
jgi:CubicO group peptidase (beta-lactamase class C family)